MTVETYLLATVVERKRSDLICWGVALFRTVFVVGMFLSGDFGITKHRNVS